MNSPFVFMLIRELEKAGFDRDQIREELGL